MVVLGVDRILSAIELHVFHSFFFLHRLFHLDKVYSASRLSSIQIGSFSILFLITDCELLDTKYASVFAIHALLQSVCF